MAIIPKNIFYYWEIGEVSRRYADNIRYTTIINPNHNVRVINDNECLVLLDKILPDYVEIYQKIQIPSCKADIMRMLLLYEYGGWYLDCDTKPRCAVEYFEQEGKDLCLFWVKNNKGKVSIQATPIGGSAGHPFFLHATKTFFELLGSRLNNHSVYTMTGPTAILAAAGAYIRQNTTTFEELDYSYVDVEGDGTKGSWTYQEACGIVLDKNNPCIFRTDRKLDQIGSLDAFRYFKTIFDRYPETRKINYRKLMLKAGIHFVAEHGLNDEIVDLSLKYVDPADHPKYYTQLRGVLAELKDDINAKRISI